MNYLNNFNFLQYLCFLMEFICKSYSSKLRTKTNFEKVIHYLDSWIKMTRLLSEYISDYIKRLWFYTFTFRLFKIKDANFSSSHIVAMTTLEPLSMRKKIYQSCMTSLWINDIIQLNQLWSRYRVSTSKHHCNDKHVISVLFPRK